MIVDAVMRGTMVKKSRTFPNTRVERDKIRFARFTRSIIRGIAVVIGVIFAYLQLKDVQANTLLTSSTADIIWRAALVIYYWAWVVGVTFDTNIQELAYVSFPGNGRWPFQAMGVVAIFVVIAYILLQSHGNIAHFSLALTAFLIVDHATWLYIRRFLRDTIDQSRTRYTRQKQFYELEILNTVEGQVFGEWKLWRLLTGTIIVLTADVFSFNQAFRDASANVVQIICPWLSSGEAASIFYSSLVLLFVVAMEMWHWLLRIRTYLRMDTLEHLHTSYRLVPR
jgi:hypothetical protein